jgi:hypothetical protein
MEQYVCPGEVKALVDVILTGNHALASSDNRSTIVSRTVFYLFVVYLTTLFQ